MDQALQVCFASASICVSSAGVEKTGFKPASGHGGGGKVYNNVYQDSGQTIGRPWCVACCRLILQLAWWAQNPTQKP